MKVQDDRKPEERVTYCWLIVGTDRFLSGWGEAKGGVSYAAWACTDQDREIVKRWVRNRGDMLRVREVYDANGTYRPKEKGHLHIYVVRDDHPARQI